MHSLLRHNAVIVLAMVKIYNYYKNICSKMFSKQKNSQAINNQIAI